MKHCVITGAADGIGRALALTFAAKGYAITGIDVDAKRAEQTRAELERAGAEIVFIMADLADRKDDAKIFDQLAKGPPIDVFIHNAGINRVGRFGDFDADQQRKIVEIDLIAPMVLTRELLARNQITAPGSLVFISSLSSYVSYPGGTVYAASKSGVASYARSLGVALARCGVHVLTVYPGATRTRMAAQCSPRRNFRAVKSRMPSRRLASAIFHAVSRRRRILIPGFQNKLFAWMGRYLSCIMNAIMRRLMFESLDTVPKQDE